MVNLKAAERSRRADLKVTSQFPAGTLIRQQALTVSWTGGDSSMTVVVRVVSHLFLTDYNLLAAANAADGSVTFQTMENQGQYRLPIVSSDNVEIILDAGPDPVQGPPFTGLGLALGGRLNWKYEYRFSGLTLQ